MIKLRTIVILLIIYVVSYISVLCHINLLYPYYVLKDLLLYPVHALSNNHDLEISNSLHDSIISSLQEDISDLKKLNNINTVLSDFKYTNATIIERNRQYWFNTITIDKGKKDGIKEDMAVINNDGLIGRISTVGFNTSTIKLITTNDVKNKISVVIKNNSKDVYGILNGYDSENNLLKIILHEKVELNDKAKVETTGLGGIFPKGILIGEVYDTMQEDDLVSEIVLVKPIVNLEGESYVSILQRKEDNS